MGWRLKEVKQLHLDSLVGSLSKLEPSLSLGCYLCWKWGHSQAGAGRKRRTVISKECALGAEWQPCRSRLAARAMNLARKLLQPLALLKIWCRAGALEPGWGARGGHGVGLLHIQLQSHRAALLSPLGPSCRLSVLHRKTKMCTQQRSCHPVPVLSLEEKPFTFSPVVPEHFPSIVWSGTDLSCCVTVCSAERDVEAAKRWKILFPVM